MPYHFRSTAYDKKAPAEAEAFHVFKRKIFTVLNL